MKTTDDQNTIEQDGIVAIFKESSGDCSRCCFRSKCVPFIPCRPEERGDGKTGHFELNK